MDPVSIGLMALKFLASNGPTIISMIEGKTAIGEGVEEILGLVQTVHSVGADPSQPDAEAKLNDSISQLETLIKQQAA